MDMVILGANLLALLAGGGMFALTCRMVKAFRIQYLSDYLFFLVFSIIAGFFDWILFNFITVFIPAVQFKESDAIYHIFWDLIGLPAVLLSVYFLFRTFSGMLEISIPRIIHRVAGILFSAILAVSILSTLFRTPQVHFPLSSLLVNLFWYGLPALQAAVILISYHRAARSRMTEGPFVRRFILYFFAGYSIWHLISYLPSPLHPSYHLSILWYYCLLIPPTMALRNHLASRQSSEVFAAISKDGLRAFFLRHELTGREQDVVLLLLKGKSYKAMADELFISMQTVKNYVSRIYKKLNLGNRVELLNLVRNTMDEK